MKYACVKCRHEQEVISFCECCGSFQVILISVLKELWGEDWRTIDHDQKN